MSKASKVHFERRLANMKVVDEWARTERVEHTPWIAHLKGTLHELKGKLDFSKRYNNDADLRYAMLTEERDFLKRQIATGGVCSGDYVQRLANVSMDVDGSIYDLNLHAAHV